MNTVFVTSVTEPAGVTPAGAERTLTWTITGPNPGNFNTTYYASDGAAITVFMSLFFDTQLRLIGYWNVETAADLDYAVSFDSANNVQTQTQTTYGFDAGTGTGRVDRYVYGAHGNVLTHTIDGFAGSETTTYYNASEYYRLL